MSPKPPLEVTIETRSLGQDDAAVIRAKGEIDLATAERLAAALASPACANENGLLLDLTEVGFIDSSGLRVVMVAMRDFPRLGVVFAEGSPVERLFELAQMLDRVPCFRSEEEAIAALMDGHP
jgi:anti-sigma B factor antagonist